MTAASIHQYFLKPDAAAAGLAELATGGVSGEGGGVLDSGSIKLLRARYIYCTPPRPELISKPDFLAIIRTMRWSSGKASVCKAEDIGSIPVRISIFLFYARSRVYSRKITKPEPFL